MQRKPSKCQKLAQSHYPHHRLLAIQQLICLFARKLSQSRRDLTPLGTLSHKRQILSQQSSMLDLTFCIAFTLPPPRSDEISNNSSPRTLSHTCRPVIKLSKLSGGSARAQLSGLHARFGLLGGPSWPLGLGLVRPSVLGTLVSLAPDWLGASRGP